MSDKRNVLLDYIRGVACIIVVLYHYTQRFEDLYHSTSKWGFRLGFGWMGIAVFYILSGYLSVIKDESKKNAIDFIKKKAMRLYPTYWVCIIITFLGTSLYLKDRAVSIVEFIINFTMLESFVGANLVDGAYWTLANELVFYAFIFLIVVILKKYSKLPVFFLGWMSLLFIFTLIERNNLIFDVLGKIIARPYGHMFIAGSSIHFCSSELKKTKALSILNICLAVLYQFIMFDVIYSFFFIAIIGCVALSVSFNRKQITINKKLKVLLNPLGFIASISYPMYLLHQNWGYIIMLGLINKGYDSEFIIIIPMLILGIASCSIHYFVETPMLSIRKNRERISK